MITTASARASILLLGLAVFAFSGADAEETEPVIDKSPNASWIAVGGKGDPGTGDRSATVWIQPKSYRAFRNQFSINAKFVDKRGRYLGGNLYLGCDDKKHAFVHNGYQGRWNGVRKYAIPKESVPDIVGMMYCKHTAARAEWGYTSETAYLWDAPLPLGVPRNAPGNWVTVIDNGDEELRYSDSVQVDNEVALYAVCRKLATSKAPRCQWVRQSCKENLVSLFFSPDLFTGLGTSGDGFWKAPKPDHLNATSGALRKRFCS
jgi:hypothetical protein